MPLSTSIAKYPIAMLDVIENVCETGVAATMPFPTTREAKAVRFKFYGLIKALSINRHSLADKAERLEFKLVGEDRKKPNTLIIRYPDQSAEDAYFSAVAARVLQDAGRK